MSTLEQQRKAISSARRSLEHEIKDIVTIDPETIPEMQQESQYLLDAIETLRRIEQFAQLFKGESK